MMRPLTLLVAACLLLHGNTFAQAADSNEKMIRKEEVQTTFRLMTTLDPKLGDLWVKLVKQWGDKPEYPAAEVRSIIGPPKKEPRTMQSYENDKRPNAPATRGELPAAEVETALRVINQAAEKKTPEQNLADVQKEFANADREALLKALAATRPAYTDPVVALHKKFNKRDSYLAREYRDVLEYGGSPAKKLANEPSPEVKPSPTVWDKIRYTITHPKIRQSWSDVLAGEDPTVSSPANKLSDLVGAVASYSRDRLTDNDSWNITGAVIFPYVIENVPDSSDLFPELLTIAPSATINRLVNGNNPAKDVDEVLYRVGIYASWLNPIGAVDARLAGVYATDSDHQAQLPGYELDIEPQFDWYGIDFASDYLKVGYRNVLLRKHPVLADQSDNSALDYQLRIFAHMEGGDMQNLADQWTALSESFTRIGPVAQLRLNMPGLVFGKTFSLTAQYAKMSSIDGPNEHDESLKVDATLTLLEDVTTGNRISVNANYTKGGTSFIQQEVDQFTLGLSVRF